MRYIKKKREIMKKLKLIAALVAAAPLLSHADVTIYGSIRAGLNTYKSAETNQRINGVDDYNSRIGFKGNEDLGNGLKAIWQVETGFAVDGTNGEPGTTSSGAFANRASFVGLEGNFGTVRLGNLVDVTSDTESTDIWYDSRKSGFTFPLYEYENKLETFTDTTFKNSIRYDSPNLYGFTGTLHYGADESAQAGRPKGTRLGARLGYSNNAGFFGAYAYQAIQNQGANNDKTSAINRIEAGYDANNLYLAATYNWSKYYPGVGAIHHDGVNFTKFEGQIWALTAAYTIGAFQPKVTYSQASDPKIDGGHYKLDRQQFAVGVDYLLSKRSRAGLEYGQINYGEGFKKDLGWKSDKSNSVGVYLKYDL
ncbi:porin [Neisseriaceae bacterium JH1-16]|nr:porin [Neisseriaceae bacterium JH1-16]